MSEEQPIDMAVALFELSQTPQFPAFYELLNRIAKDFYSDMPRSDADKTKYETSNYVSNTIRVIFAKLQEEIEVGQRLSTDKNIGGETHGADEGRYQRRRV